MTIKLSQRLIDDLIDDAIAAGRAAGLGVVPQPMYIQGYAPVMDGACGFAWVNVKPANSAVAKRLVARGMARKDGYYGGVTVWISDYNQSMTRKEAHARAFAATLAAAGIRAYSASRMD